MMPKNHRCKQNISGWVGLLVLLWVSAGVWACAALPPAASKDNRTCNAEADAAVASGQWWQAAERHQQVLGQDPSNCLAMYHLGYIWGQLDDHAKEIAWYNKAITCGYADNDELFFNLGMAYADTGQTKEALGAFKRAIQLNPAKVDNHFGLAMAAQVAGDSAGAEQALKQAIAVSPNYWDARILLAKIYLEQGRLEEARLQLELVLAHEPENEEAKDLYQLYKERQMTSFEH
jgi:tetratricopeptide (TPR) repeat protein